MSDTRTYVVGLPVVVTITDEGDVDAWVTVAVDLSDVGTIVLDGEVALDPVSDERLALDARLMDEWASTLDVRNEGYAHLWSEQ